MHGVSQLQPVQRARHLDVREQQRNVRPRFQNRNRLVGVAGLCRGKAGAFTISTANIRSSISSSTTRTTAGIASRCRIVMSGSFRRSQPDQLAWPMPLLAALDWRQRVEIPSSINAILCSMTGSRSPSFAVRRIVCAIAWTCEELTGSGSDATALSNATFMMAIVSGGNDAFEKSFMLESIRS